MESLSGAGHTPYMMRWFIYYLVLVFSSVCWVVAGSPLQDTSGWLEVPGDISVLTRANVSLSWKVEGGGDINMTLYRSSGEDGSDGERILTYSNDTVDRPGVQEDDIHWSYQGGQVTLVLADGIRPGQGDYQMTVEHSGRYSTLTVYRELIDVTAAEQGDYVMTVDRAGGGRLSDTTTLTVYQGDEFEYTVHLGCVNYDLSVQKNGTLVTLPAYIVAPGGVDLSVYLARKSPRADIQVNELINNSIVDNRSCQASHSCHSHMDFQNEVPVRILVSIDYGVENLDITQISVELTSDQQHITSGPGNNLLVEAVWLRFWFQCLLVAVLLFLWLLLVILLTLCCIRQCQKCQHHHHKPDSHKIPDDPDLRPVPAIYLSPADSYNGIDEDTVSVYSQEYPEKVEDQEDQDQQKLGSPPQAVFNEDSDIDRASSTEIHQPDPVADSGFVSVWTPDINSSEEGSEEDYMDHRTARQLEAELDSEISDSPPSSRGSYYTCGSV